MPASVDHNVLIVRSSEKAGPTGAGATLGPDWPRHA
jgi:hypothetical protein